MSNHLSPRRALPRAASALYCAMLLGGCVLIPVPTALADPEPFTAETLTPIQVGHTTRDEVRSLFAAWPYTTDDGVQTAHIEPEISDNGRNWVFGLPRQVGDWAWAGLVVYFPGPLPVLVDMEDNYERYWVLVDFNDTDTVDAFWIAHEKAPCQAGGVCFRHAHLLVLTDAAANEAARSMPPGADRCAVYTYALDDFTTPVAVSDDENAAQLVFGKDSFLRSELAPGQRTLSVSVEATAEPAERHQSASKFDVSIACAGSGVQYVSLHRAKGKIVAVPTDSTTGVRAIEKRILVQRRVPVSSPRPVAIASGDLNTRLSAPADTTPASAIDLPD